LPESPPKEVLAFSNGKHYPLVKVHSGVDARGQDITGLECDTVDEIEALLERFDCDDMRSRKESRAEAVAELSFEDLYMVSSRKLMPRTVVTRDLFTSQTFPLLFRPRHAQRMTPLVVHVFG